MTEWLGLFFSLFAFIVSCVASVYASITRRELLRARAETEQAEQQIIELVTVIGRMARELRDRASGDK